MENNINREKWVAEALDSTRGISRVQPAAGLAERVAARLNEPQAFKVIPMPSIRRWAAAAILLLALNVGSVIYATSQKAGNGERQSNTNTNPLATELQAETTYNY